MWLRANKPIDEFVVVYVDVTINCFWHARIVPLIEKAIFALIITHILVSIHDASPRQGLWVRVWTCNDGMRSSQILRSFLAQCCNFSTRVYDYGHAIGTPDLIPLQHKWLLLSFVHVVLFVLFSEGSQVAGWWWIGFTNGQRGDILLLRWLRSAFRTR